MAHARLRTNPNLTASASSSSPSPSSATSVAAPTTPLTAASSTSSTTNPPLSPDLTSGSASTLPPPPPSSLSSSSSTAVVFFGGEERTESEKRLGVPLVNVEGTDRMWKTFLPEGVDRDHAAANVFGPNGEDISGVDFPAAVVFMGGFDPLQDWQRRYYDRLKKRGKEVELVFYPNAIHTFYSYPQLDESTALIQKFREFIRSRSPAQ